NATFKTEEVAGKPKFYALDMFPYPSGAGLHVGHPLGYIASDIVARYKRLKGYNVLHPMGYDAFGLPAEQYAIQTGQHPAITTEINAKRYREQLDKIGFSFDWSREVKTSDPAYYKWTQWIFIQLFNSWYDKKEDKARKIDELVEFFETRGNELIEAAHSPETPLFTADEWKAMTEEQQQTILLEYRLAYLSDTMVNWCPGLGTVLANEEVKDGVSERGGYPVERKLMKQWSLRITAYADRLLNDLDKIDWSDPIKEMQRNWIGKSEGALIKFHIKSTDHNIEVFTTRPDTIFGATYITLAPEHELIDKITSSENRDAVRTYVEKAKNRSERDRMADVKTVTGVNTGAFAINPFTGNTIPVWTGDYVLAGYGTGAVMAVPAHDSRDYAFANHFGLPILEVVQGGDIAKEAYEEKHGVVVNSGFISGFEVKEAMEAVINKAEELGIGKRQINYRLRDAIFSRQRYWGEPFPVYYKNGLPYVVDEKDLPLELPEVDKYLPTESGEPPLARARDWRYTPPPPPHSISPRGGESIPHSDFPEGEKRAKWETASKSSWNKLKEYSKDLRNNQTEAEKILWQHLKGKQLGYKFRRQQVVLNNIADFICLEKNLIIEVDGKIHELKKDFDAARTIQLEGQGFKVIRFDNEEVLGNIEAVLKKIISELGALPSIKEKGIEGAEVLSFGEDLGEAGGAYPLESSTMPGWAGSSWYYLRYMDPMNENEIVSKKAAEYWQDVDLYIGGAEHATGHLLYVRFWTKFLFDLGLIPIEEPAKKLINQGMIQGVSKLAYKIGLTNIFVSKNKAKGFYNKKVQEEYSNLVKNLPSEDRADITERALTSIQIEEDKKLNLVRIPVEFVNGDLLDIDKYEKDPYYLKSKFIKEDDGDFICESEVEKMSKSKYNVVNPDDIINDYGADTLRMYEMFLGPLELSKPWSTHGIEGVYKFLRKSWRLFHENKTNEKTGAAASWTLNVSEEKATKEELKVLHKTIKKIQDDIERYSFNTCISTFMICVNELTDLKCNKREILEPLTIILAPFAPHVAEEMWNKLGHNNSITYAEFPEYNEEYLTENSFEYPVSVNGKTRFKIELPLEMKKEEIEKAVLSSEEARKYINGNTPKKVIVVPGRIVNIVL
ncbi:MAG: leucine--tRNA ligase, partial [Bacteroidia bacterium]